GLGLIGFETESGKFTSVWTDARSTRMSIRQSRDRFDGTAIVLYAQALADEDKRFGGSRTVTRLEAEDRTVVHRLFVSGADGKGGLIMELVLTRKTQENPKAKQGERWPLTGLRLARGSFFLLKFPR